MRLEFTAKEAIYALAFIFGIVVSLLLVAAGIVVSPFTIGLGVIVLILMVFLGHVMKNAGVLSEDALPLWYMFSVGVIMFLFGAIHAGLIPIAIAYSATLLEIEFTSAMLYAIVIIAVVAAVAVVWAVLSKKP